MNHYRISGVPITEGAKLVGILTNRDLRFVRDTRRPVREVMTSENLITVPEGTTLEEAAEILHKHRIEKLLVVNGKGELRGLITVKDIQKKLDYPDACKDERGPPARGRRRGRGRRDHAARRAAGGGGRGPAGGRHRPRPLAQRASTRCAAVKARYPRAQVLAGNIATGAAAAGPDRRGRRRGEGGHRPRLHLHHPRGRRRGRAPDHRHRRRGGA